MRLIIFLINIIVIIDPTVTEAGNPEVQADLNPPNKKMFLTGRNCSEASPCRRPNQYCNANNECQCEIGFLAVDYITEYKECRTIFCKGRHEICRNMFGPETICFNGQCLCGPGFQRSQKWDNCRSFAEHLGGSCKELGRFCGIGATCSNNGTCTCLIGYQQVNHYNCEQPTPCGPLRVNFCEDITIGSKCDKTVDVNGACRCLWPSRPNSDNTACIPEGSPRGSECNKKPNNDSLEAVCGTGAVCSSIHGCVCKQGYEASSTNNVTCELLQCNSDDDCSKAFQNTVCDYDHNDCRCSPGYSIDQLSQECVRDPLSSTEITTFIFSIFTFLCSICVYFFSLYALWPFFKEDRD